MKVEQNVNTSPPPLEIKEEHSKKDKSGDIGVIILNILLALVTIFLLAYIAYKNGYINLDNILNVAEEGKEEEESEEMEDTSEVEEYNGEVLSATLPTGWSIVEYFDGEGSNMMTEGIEYSGLTGMKIMKGTKEIMRLEAVWGIGFVGCPEIPRFKDSSTEYEKEQEDIMKEIGDEISFLNYTNTPYSDFEWLGKSFRRVSVFLYYDTIAGDEYFQPQCERDFFSLEGFEFEDEDGYKGSAYMYTISDEATAEELELLDKILASMSV
jgi:hypothetical protein